jgi:crotonobetainyl-CoA:carnitine CoA-transferase CaiB-like acyl-CoA transferase
VLSGLRVLDLTHVIAGPVCTRTLAAHGARVTTLLRPGDTVFAADDILRGKTALTVDIADPAQRDRIRGLVGEADVVVDGYRSGAIERALGGGVGMLFFFSFAFAVVVVHWF